MNEIGKRLKTLRESKNISQAGLAKAFGKSQVAISKYETGNRQLDYEMLNKYAKYFNVSTDYLLGRVDRPNELYITAEDYPEILKPLLIGGKSFIKIKAKTNDFSEEISSREKTEAIEDALKKINLNDCIDELNKSGDPQLLKQFEFLLACLPDELKYKKDNLSLYEFLEHTVNSKTFIEQVKNNSYYDNRGELVFDKESPNAHLKTLENRFVDLDNLMVKVGYHIEKVNNSFSFVGEHGGYLVDEKDIEVLETQIKDYIGYACAKFEKKLIDSSSDSPLYLRVKEPKKP